MRFPIFHANSLLLGGEDMEAVEKPMLVMLYADERHRYARLLEHN